MPVTLTPFVEGTLCQGASWQVPDEDDLAYHIARIALGQSRHIERILAGIQMGPPPTLATSAASAIEMLTVNAGQPYHRDGWIFQAMSWIAAHKAAPSSIIRAPQMIVADKGFDGLQLIIDEHNQLITSAIIFEDKATENARDTIRDYVWPELGAFESGKSANVLTAEITALLGTRPAIDPDAAIAKVIWMQARCYRVSITVGIGHANSTGRQRLFHGYDGVVVGDINRRRGETFLVQDLRAWMERLASKAILEIRKLTPNV